MVFSLYGMDNSRKKEILNVISNELPTTYKSSQNCTHTVNSNISNNSLASLSDFEDNPPRYG